MATIKTNLNYFLALFFTGSMFALWLVTPFLVRLFISAGVGSTSSSIGANSLVIALVFIVFRIAWKRNGEILTIRYKNRRRNSLSLR